MAIVNVVLDDGGQNTKMPAFERKRASSGIFLAGEAVRQPQLQPSIFHVGPAAEPGVSALPFDALLLLPNLSVS